MTNLIAVALALGLSCLPILLQPLIIKFNRRRDNASSANQPDGISDGIELDNGDEPGSNGQTSLLPAAHLRDEPSGDTEGRRRSLLGFQSIGDGLSRAGDTIFGGRLEVGVNDAGIRWLGRQVVTNAREDSLRFSLALLFAFCLVSLFVLEQTLAILSGNIISGSAVLSIHPHCGYWTMNVSAYETNGRVGWDYNFLERKMARSKEARALRHAEKCYGDSDGTENCNIFGAPVIDYNMTRNAPCPFSGDVCANGPSGALAMDTGYRDLSTIGWNGPGPVLFRRKTVCAPVVTNSTYVRLGFRNESWTSGYCDYRYGYPSQQAPDPILWTQSAVDSDGAVGHYQLYIFGSLITDGYQDGFIPLPEFQVQDGATTLFFVQSHGVLYSQPRIDPIFPTDSNTTLRISNTSALFYYRTIPTATVLGCVDHHEVCGGRGGACGYFNTQRETESSSLKSMSDSGAYPNQIRYYMPALIFMFYSFLHSGSQWAYKYLGASGLDVWGKTWNEMSHGISFGPSKDQWEIEAQKIFNVSLARLQLNALGITRGEKLGGDVKELNQLDSSGNQALGSELVCRGLKIEGVGWRNVSFFWFVSLLLLSFCLFVGSIEFAGTLISVRVWNAIYRACQFLNTTVLAPLCRRFASIRWRDCLTKTLNVFRSAANRLGQVRGRFWRPRGRSHGGSSVILDE